MHAALALENTADLLARADARRRRVARLRESLRETPGLTLLGEMPELRRHAYHIVAARHDSRRFSGLSRQRVILALCAEGIPVHGGWPRRLCELPSVQRRCRVHPTPVRAGGYALPPVRGPFGEPQTQPQHENVVVIAERSNGQSAATARERWYADFFSEMRQEYLGYRFTRGTSSEVQTLIERLALKPGARVLDIACGVGRHALELAKRGIRVHGVDLSGSMIEVAREHAKQLGVDATFEVLDARSVPASGDYDAAYTVCEGAFSLLQDDHQDRKVLEAAFGAPPMTVMPCDAASGYAAAPRAVRARATSVRRGEANLCGYQTRVSCSTKQGPPPPNRRRFWCRLPGLRFVRAHIVLVVGLCAVFVVLTRAGFARAELVIVQLKSGGELRGELLELVPGRHIVVDVGSHEPTRIAKSQIKWVYRDVPPVQVRDPFDPEFVIVELKSGRELKGELVELVPGAYITIDAGGGREVRVPKENIKWVQRKVDRAQIGEKSKVPASEQAVARPDPNVTSTSPAQKAKKVESDAVVEANKPPRPDTATTSSAASDDSDEVLARRAFIAGRSAFEQGRFGDALTHFEVAYRLSGRPELLYNIGLAADSQHLVQKAVDGYAAYLRARPHSSLRAAIEQRITTLRLR